MHVLYVLTFLSLCAVGLQRGFVWTAEPGLRRGNRRLKHEEGTAVILSRSWWAACVACECVLLVALNAVFIPWLVRLWRARRRAPRRPWTQRRAHLGIESVLKGVAMNVLLLAELVARAEVLARPAQFCAGSSVQAVAFFISYQAWLVLSTLLLLDVHGPRPMPLRPGAVVKDLPYKWHLAKWVILLGGTGVHGATASSV